MIAEWPVQVEVDRAGSTVSAWTSEACVVKGLNGRLPLPILKYFVIIFQRLMPSCSLAGRDTETCRGGVLFDSYTLALSGPCRRIDPAQIAQS